MLRVLTLNKHSRSYHDNRTQAKECETEASQEESFGQQSGSKEAPQRGKTGVQKEQNQDCRRAKEESSAFD